MIKSICLNQRAKLGKKVTKHCTYKEARTIGILYNMDEFDEEVLSKLIIIFQGDGKTIAKLGYTDRLDVPEKSKNFIFTKKDISNIGVIKNDHISFFIRQTFDFLISLDSSQNINYKYILAISKASCKVGLETESYKDLLLMSIKQGKQKSESALSLVKYLKMI
ncbi:MAG: hypothetical protein GDA42_06625 [Ekhidna sp.]|nr:hypothetical protein [Ekhidna sp.]MBC6410119.1 hypothetical protein [Ekhidna sp.]